MSTNLLELIGATLVIRCGHVQADRDYCGRRLSIWTVEADGLKEKRPPDVHGDAVRGERVGYRCHPKRCGAMYPIRLETILPKIREGIEGGAAELWLGDATTWWLK